MCSTLTSSSFENTLAEFCRRWPEIRIISRDEKGKVMVACCDQRSNVEQPAITESYALRKMMEICSTLNFNKVILEGDAQVIVNTVNDVNEYISYYKASSKT